MAIGNVGDYHIADYCYFILPAAAYYNRFDGGRCKRINSGKALHIAAYQNDSVKSLI